MPYPYLCRFGISTLKNSERICEYIFLELLGSFPSGDRDATVALGKLLARRRNYFFPDCNLLGNIRNPLAERQTTFLQHPAFPGIIRHFADDIFCKYYKVI